MIILRAAELKALIPVSDGAALSRLARSPRLAMQMQVDPMGAFEKARSETLDSALQSPVPADAWVRRITEAVESVAGRRLADHEKRKLCAYALGEAIHHGRDLQVMDEDGDVFVCVGSRRLVRIEKEGRGRRPGM